MCQLDYPKNQLVEVATKPFELAGEYLNRGLKRSENLTKHEGAEPVKKEFVSLDLLIDKPSTDLYKFTSQGCVNGSAKKVDAIRRQADFECSTQVTFSELNHPIPSVSPIKDTAKDHDQAKPVRVSQSPNLFNDLESVLNDTEEFSFHSALARNVERVPSKTPEKLLSVPPSVIMNDKKSSLIFDSFEFDKAVGIESLDSHLAVAGGQTSATQT